MVYVSEIVIFHQTHPSPNAKHHKLHTVLCRTVLHCTLILFPGFVYTFDWDKGRISRSH